MNHAGSASGLSVCKTTNQEKFDLTQAGKFPSITRGKCWCIRERPRTGDSPRGRGRAGGPVRALGGSRVGGRHPRAPAAPAPEQPSSPGLSLSLPAPLLGFLWGPCQSLDRSPPCSLTLPAPPHRAPEQALFLSSSFFVHTVPTASSIRPPF